MDLNELQVFLDVNKYGSFEKVAEERFLSQRSISKQMKHLENELQVKLFFRGRNKISLTPAGFAFVEQAKELVNLTEQSIFQIREISRQSLPSLRIGFFSSYETNILAQTIESYQNNANNPKINFVIKQEPIEQLLNDLKKGNLDCILMPSYGNNTFWQDTSFNSEVIKTVPLNVAVNRKNHLANFKRLTFSDISTEPIFFFSNYNTHYFSNLLNKFSNKTFQPSLIQVETFDLLRIMLLVNKGITLSPNYYDQILDPTREWIKFIPLDDKLQLRCTIRWIFRKKNNENSFNLFKKYILQNK